MTQYQKLLDDNLDVPNYQKLLDDDADMFENFLLNKNDEVLELLWSIQQDEKKNTTNLSEKEKKYEFKYIEEKRKDQLDTKITPAELGFVNSTSVSTSIRVNSENGYSRTVNSSTFPDIEHKLLSNRQESPTPSTDGFWQLLYSPEETGEHSLPKKEYILKNSVKKNKLSEHNLKKENEVGHITDNNSTFSYFSQETNVSDYQKLLNDESLNAFEASDKFIQGEQNESVYRKQTNAIENNNNAQKASQLSLNVEKGRIPGDDIQPEIHNINKYICCDTNSKDTEYTFKFVREKNYGNPNIFKKDHIHSLSLQPLQETKSSVLNGKNVQQNINYDFQSSINLYEENSLCNHPQTFEIPRESPNNNQDNLNHSHRNYFRRIHTFKNKKFGSKKHTNVSNFQEQSSFSRTTNSTPIILHIPNKNINKLKLNSCHSLTNNNQYLNTKQTEQYSLIPDKQSCSVSFAENAQNICKSKRANDKNILRKIKEKSRTKKAKLKMDVVSSLKNSVKYYYGVSKSLVKNTNVRLSKNENTTTREQLLIFEKSKPCKRFLSNECDLQADGIVKHKPEHIKQSMGKSYLAFSTNSSLGIVNDANISKSNTNMVNEENTHSKQDISLTCPGLDQKRLSNKPETSTLIETNGFWKLLRSLEETDEEHPLPKEEYKSKYRVEKNKSFEHNAKIENEGRHSISNNYNSSQFSQGTYISDYQTLLSDESLNVFEESNKCVQAQQNVSVYRKQTNSIQNNNAQKASQLSLNAEKDRKPGVEIQPEIRNINKYLCFDTTSKDTEYTFKFVREKNDSNANIFKKDSLSLQPLQVSKTSVFNGKNVEQNINNDIQSSINLYQENSLCNHLQTFKISSETRNNNQENLNYHYHRNYFPRIHPFKNKKNGSKEHTNVSDFQEQNFSSRATNRTPNIPHIRNKNINKHELNSPSLTNNVQYLSTVQTKQYSLIPDKQSCSVSLAENGQSICKSKQPNDENILRRVKEKSRAKKPKLKIDVVSSLENSVKYYYGVSKSLVKSPNVSLSKNESTTPCEQLLMFGKSKPNNELLQNHMKQNRIRTHSQMRTNITDNPISCNIDVPTTSSDVFQLPLKYLQSSQENKDYRGNNEDVHIIDNNSKSSYFSQETNVSDYQKLLSDESLNVFEDSNKCVQEQQNESVYKKQTNSIEHNNAQKANQLSLNVEKDRILGIDIQPEIHNINKYLCFHRNSKDTENTFKFVRDKNDSNAKIFKKDHLQSLSLQPLQVSKPSMLNGKNTQQNINNDFQNSKDTENTFKFVREKNNSNENIFKTDHLHSLSLQPLQVRKPSMLNGKTTQQSNINNDFQNSFDLYQQNSLCNHSRTLAILEESSNSRNKSQTSKEIFRIPSTDNASKKTCSKHYGASRKFSSSSLRDTQPLESSSFQERSDGKSFEYLDINYSIRNEEQNAEDNIEKCNNLSQLHNNTTNFISESNAYNSEVFQSEYLKNSQNKPNSCVNLPQSFCNRKHKKPTYKKTKKKSRIAEKTKLNIKSIRLKNKSVATYYKDITLSVDKTQTEGISNDKNTIDYDTQILDGYFNIEKGKNDQENNNTQTSNINSDNFELLPKNISVHNQDLSKSENAKGNIGNVHITDNKGQTIVAKRNDIIDYVNEENVMDSPHYLFNSQGITLISKEQNSSNTKLSNTRSFSGENSERTYTTVCDNKNNHILKEIISQNISNSNNENIFQAVKTDCYTEMKYLKSFIEDKLRNIRDYLCRCQKQPNEDDGSYVNKIILNSLSNPLEDALLDELQSPELFSQSLTFTPSFVEYATMKSSQSEKKTNAKFDTPEYKNLAKAIDDLSRNKSLISQTASEISVPESIKKMFILRKVSDLFSKFLSDIQNNRFPVIQIRDQTNWQNSCFTNNILVMKPIGETKNIRIKPNFRQGTSKFNLMIYIIGKLTDLLINNQTCTKRELYYQIVTFVKRQDQVNTAVNSISCLLDEPHWDFGILTTNKGLVYGDLTVLLSENEVIYCNIHGGSLIPQNQSKITKLVSNASFILVVEKDSIFQKLLDQDLPNALPRTFIMITGKGFPDVVTRLFIKKLWHVLKIPVLVLVDADPYGIEIMLTYRFGSLTLAHLSEYLALPSLRWIGIHPKEIITLGISHQPLTVKDKRKIQELLKRPYINSVPEIKLELEIMAARNFKAEIEGAMKSNNYFKDIYIPRKLCAQEYF